MPLSAAILEKVGSTEELLLKQLTRDIKEIFASMIGMDDLLHLPLQIDPLSSFTDCVSAMVGLAGNLNGIVCIHLPGTLALRIASNMLDDNLEEIDEDVRDALGEVANMIAGSFKMHLSKNGTDIRLSTPSVVSGKEYIVTLTNKNENLTIRFATDDDWFVVTVAFEDN